MTDTKTQTVEEYLASLGATPDPAAVDPYAASADEVVNLELADASKVAPTVVADGSATVEVPQSPAYTTPEVLPQLIGDYLAADGGTQAAEASLSDDIAAETARATAAEAYLQSEIDALSGSIGPTIEPIITRQDDADAERRAAEAAINQALADELAARAAADAAEAAARNALSTATTQALAQASADIQAAHDAAMLAQEQAADALTTAQGEIATTAAQAASALAQAKTDLQGSINSTKSDLQGVINSTKGDLQTAIAAVQASSDGVAANLASETTARQTADSAEVTARTAAVAGVQTGLNTVAAALTTEQTTRANADSAETSARQAAVAVVQGAVDTVSAALTNEISVRSSADSAETTARQNAVSQVQNNVNTVSAALASEATTRANADSAETTARQSAVAAVQGAVDTVAAGLSNEITVRAAADSAETSARQAAVSTVQNNVDTVAAGLVSEQTTRASADAAETSARQTAISSIQGQVNDVNAALTNETNTRATNDAAETSERTAAVSNLQGQINTTNAALTSEASTRSTADAAETSARQAAVSSLQGQVNDVSAGLASEASTRATADAAETTQRNIAISQYAPGGSLLDPLFARSNIANNVLPWGWTDWSWGTTICSIVAGKIGARALRIDNNAAQGADQGIAIVPGAAWLGPDLRTHRYFVVEIDFEYISGDLTGAGFLFYGYDASGGINSAASDRVTFASITGPSPQAGRIYTIRKFVDGYGGRVPSNPSAVTTILHLFGAWTGFTSTPATKSFIIHRINPRAATQSEIETGTAGGAIGAAITAEANTRATADSAETSQRQAAVSSLQGAIDSANAAIVSEANTRATNDTAETNARNAQVSSLQGQINSTNAALTSESSTRASADSAETTARQNAISSVQTDIANVNAALTNEASTRSSADAAETSARQAAVSALQGDIATANAAISNEATTRATADAAETAARQAQVSAWSAKGSPKRVWTQTTAPTFDQIFPPGVNACPLGNLDTGNPFDAGCGTWTNTARVVSTGIDAGGWQLESGHTVYAYLNGNWAAQSTYECFDINGFGQAYGIVPGATYEASVYTGAHRSRVAVHIIFYDVNWNGLHDVQSADVNDWQASGGVSLSGYKRLSVRGVAPSNAHHAMMYVRADNQGANNKAGQASPYIFATRPQWARVTPELSQPIDWQPYDAPVWINTGDAYRMYRWSGIGGATWVEYSDTRIAANAAAITNEAATRASADSAETSQRQAAISGVQTQIDSTNAALASEASTRATADSAETSARQSAVSGLQNSVNSINAAIVTEQNTRASADSAETTARQQQVSQLSTPGGALVDPLFARNNIAANTIPWGWADWSYGASLCSIVAGRIGDKALQMTDSGASDTGIVIVEGDPVSWAGACHRTSRYFVIEIDFEWLSGNPKGAGFLFYGYDSDSASTTNWTFAGFKELTGSSPTTGKIYSMRKFVDGYAQHVPANPAHVQSIFHLFGGWGTIYYDQQGNTTPVAKSFKVHRANVRAATQTEIENGTVAGAVGAAITSEANTRASADSAETSARQSAVSSLQNGLNSANAAIASESSTRAAADAAEATARLTLSTSLSAQVSPKRTFRAPTAPTFDDMFPVGVQACPVGSLKLSDGVNGLAAGSNTARGYDAAALWTNTEWNLTGEAALVTHLTGTWANSNTTYEVIDLLYFGQCYNIVAGRRYEWSVYTGAHRCRVYASVTFYDDNWNNLGSVDSTGYGGLYGFGGVNAAEKNSGNSLSNWKRLGMIGQAPAGATKASFLVRGDNVGFAGQSDPYVMACRPYFGLARNDQTALTDWQPFEAPLWIKTSENNKQYLWSGILGAGFVAVDDARIASNTTSISQLFSATDGLKAMWGVQIDSNGKVIGRVKLDGSNGTSSFDVLATSFTVSMPGYNSPIFEVGYVGGSPKVTIRADVIQDGSITDGKVDNVNLNAPTFASGAGTASITVALRGGQPVAIIAKCSSASGMGTSSFTLKQGTTTLATETTNNVSTDPNTGATYVPPMILLASFTPPSTGNYTFSVSAASYFSSPQVALYVDRPYK